MSLLVTTIKCSASFSYAREIHLRSDDPEDEHVSWHLRLRSLMANKGSDARLLRTCHTRRANACVIAALDAVMAYTPPPGANMG